MKSKTIMILMLVIAIPTAAVVAMTMTAGGLISGSRDQAKSIPSEMFTYQGELLNGDVPEAGPCDIQFGLWDEVELGSQIGLTQTLESVNLIDGRFTVEVNDSDQFTTDPFDGSPRYLAISVDCPSGTGAYVALSPRQPLTPVPYSHYAESAGSTAWSGITSMPDGFLDGIDDDTLYEAGTGLALISTTFNLADIYQLPQTCDPGQVVEWTGSTWGCHIPDSGGGPDYANVIVVAKSGGAFDVIQEALSSISGADADNRYLVWVAPGVYSETVVMKSYVDIEGAGENLTKITGPGSDVSHESTVRAAANSELRSLTVENTGGNTLATGIISYIDEFTMLHVTVIVSGGSNSNYGISVAGGEKFNQFRHLTIDVDGSNASVGSYGLYLLAGGGVQRVIVTDASVHVSGASTGGMTGVFNRATSGHRGIITGTQMTVEVNNAGDGKGRAVAASGQDSTTILVDDQLSGFGGHIDSSGLHAESESTVAVRNLTVRGSSRGLFVHDSSGPCNVRIDGSKIHGGTYSVYVLGSGASTVNIGSSLLDGAINDNPSAILTCVGTYDENYTNTNGFTACP
jgi:hypothetical protein